MLAELTQTPSFLMSDIARRMRYRFDARTRALGVTRPQWRLLLMLARFDGPSQSELAEMLDVERITLCRMIDRLAESGMVERRADPSDRRIWRIYLSAKAMPLVGQLTVIAGEFERALLSSLSTAEVASLTEMLGRIHERLREADDTEQEQAKVAGAAR